MYDKGKNGSQLSHVGLGGHVCFWMERQAGSERWKANGSEDLDTQLTNPVTTLEYWAAQWIFEYTPLPIHIAILSVFSGDQTMRRKLSKLWEHGVWGDQASGLIALYFTAQCPVSCLLCVSCFQRLENWVIWHWESSSGLLQRKS